MSRDGSGYSGALILACRKTLPDEVSTAEGFEAALRREFKNLPEVRAMQLSCRLPMAPHMDGCTTPLYTRTAVFVMFPHSRSECRCLL